ncbi:MAG: TetR/AcrR family transcriptional regulator [Pseudomonadota bacterium]
MARYKPEHKDVSKQSLIEASASAFRSYGYHGVGINDLCAGAGLTRGAFYGHFRAKSDLFRAVIAGAHDFITRLRNRTARSDTGLKRQAAQVASDYLEPANAQAVVGGCSIASLAMDVVRSDDTTRDAYAEAVKQIVAEFRRGIDGEIIDPQAARSALALCVGGLLIHNACGQDAEGAAVAKAAQQEVRRLLSRRV